MWVNKEWHWLLLVVAKPIIGAYPLLVFTMHNQWFMTLWLSPGLVPDNPFALFVELAALFLEVHLFKSARIAAALGR